MKEIIEDGRTFRVTDAPEGLVWNIGRKNFPYEGYLPMFGKYVEGMPYHVDVTTLTAYHIGDENVCAAIADRAGHSDVDANMVREMVELLMPRGKQTLTKKFYAIEMLKHRMYESGHWKDGSIVKAAAWYASMVRKYVPRHRYYEYLVWCLDNLCDPDSKRHTFAMMCEAFPDTSVDWLERSWKASVKEWKEANGYK